MSDKSYTELLKLKTFEERFEYLRLNGRVGDETLAFRRIFGQRFYQRSPEWKRIRDYVITRDNGCDLGIPGRVIYGERVIVHHINPLTLEDIERHSDKLLDPENLITTTHNTHNAIHYGDASLLVPDPIVRTRNDTCPWKKG